MYDQADVSCLVENEEGENVASTNLDVNYAPTILLHPRSNLLFFKHILKLSKKKTPTTAIFSVSLFPGPRLQREKTM